MSIKHTLLLSAVFTLFTVSPTYSGNIISCDSFETCPDGETSSTIIVGLEDKITELEAEIVARQNDMSGRSFSDRDLSDLRLRYANFSGTNLFGAILTNADLANANLTGTNLMFADLTGANLTGTNLTSVQWLKTICPDGSNTDTNGLGYCVPLP